MLDIYVYIKYICMYILNICISICIYIYQYKQKYIEKQKSSYGFPPFLITDSLFSSFLS